MKNQLTEDFVKTLVSLFGQFKIKAEVSTEYSYCKVCGMYVYVQLPDDASFNLIFDVTQFLKAYCNLVSYDTIVVTAGAKKNQLCIF